MKREYQYLVGGALAVLALGGVALGAIYLNNNMQTTSANAPVTTAHSTHIVHTNGHYAAAQPQPVAQPCDDHNIVGTVGGAAAGGLLGHQFGKGDGRTAATTAGVIGGAMLGNNMIPTRGVTCN